MKSGRIASLKKQHSQLELDIAGLHASQSINASYVQMLKRRKLQIKDMLVFALARHQPECRA